MATDPSDSLWGSGVRGEDSRRSPTETPFAYYKRAPGTLAAAVRKLLDDWVHQYPKERRADLVGRLRSNDPQFEGAFWELYLHEVFRRADYEVEVHPPVPGSTKHPDFLVVNNESRVYVEARIVERRPATLAENTRVDQVYDVLRDFQVERPFVISVGHARVGGRAMPTKPLRQFIREWLAELDHPETRACYETHGIAGVPTRVWVHEDWELELMAIPLTEHDAEPHSVLRMWGPAIGSTIENDRVILDALEGKAGAYGTLDAPLVVALLCNTEFPTATHQVERALYGLHLPHPPDAVPVRETLQPGGNGFWLSMSGWRRREVPQVLTAANLGVVGAATLDAQPVLWPHPDPTVTSALHHPCFADATLGPLQINGSVAEPRVFLELPEEVLGA